MRIHNLYTDPNGQSHFRDIEVEWVQERRGTKLSSPHGAAWSSFTSWGHQQRPKPRGQALNKILLGVHRCPMRAAVVVEPPEMDKLIDRAVVIPERP